MNKLKTLLQQIELAIPNFELQNQSTSSSTIGWQIEHILLTINLITDTMSKSNATNYKWKFNALRFLIIATGKIPRGKGKAPSRVTPSNIITIESINKNIALAKQNLEILNAMPKNSYFEHPYFGKLNTKPTIKFLTIHTNHHLKIINDIKTASSI